jgi:hypothetical protein
MTVIPHDPDDQIYRLVLVVPQESRVIMQIDRSEMRLPSVSVNRYRRPAEEITRLIFEQWSMDSIVIDWSSDQTEAVDTAILELRSPASSVCQNSDLVLIAVNELEAYQVSSTIVATVRRMLTGNTDGMPFLRFGWIEEVQAWFRQCISEKDVEFTNIRQFNAGGNFVLLRVHTQSKIYWVKAVGSSNALEFSTTAFLVERCPSFLPEIFDMKRDWNAWIMADCGDSLRSSNSLKQFESAATKLAELQKSLAGKTDELLRLPLVDHRLSTLKCRIDGIVSYLDEAMTKQTTTRVKRVSTHRMKEIGTILHRACDVLQELDIPNSIMHGDISPGSILSNGGDCVFTDWCEAYVGDPFITFELLCIHMANVASESHRWRSELAKVYKRSWRDLLTERQIDRAYQIVPLVAILSYFSGNGKWLLESRRYQDSFLSYARSLARRMDLTALDPELNSLL